MSLFPVFAEAEKSISLSEIDKLISTTEYNEALEQLNIYIREKPDDFDNAQKRIDKILKARQEYTKLAEELITVMENDPENDKKKLDIIARLESLEKHPSEEHLTFIRQAKIAAQFTYYRAVFNRIMQTSSLQVASRQYTEACDTAASGFSLYRDDFYDQTKDVSITGSVSEALNTTTKAVESYKQLQDNLSSSVDMFLTAVRTGDYPSSEQAFSDVQTAFINFSRIRNGVALSGWTLDSIFADMKKKDPDLTEASFIPFASHFMLGKSEDPDTGILGAMDAQWNTLMEKMKPVLYSTIAAVSEQISENLTRKNLFSADLTLFRNQFSLMKNFAELAVELNSLYGLRKQKDNTFVTDFCPQYTSSMKYIASLSNAALDFFSTITTYKTEEKKMSLYVPVDDPVEAERTGTDGYVTSMVDSAKMFVSLFENAEKALSELQQQSSTPGTAIGYDSDQIRETAGVRIEDPQLSWTTIEDTYRMICLQTASASKTVAIDQWIKIAAYFSDVGIKITDEYTAQYDWAQQLQNGITADTIQKIPVNSKIYADGHYPSEARDIALTLKKDMVRDRRILVLAQDTLTDGKQFAASFQSSLDSLNASIAKLDSLGLTCDSLIQKSDTQIMLSKRAENEADLRYGQAEANLKKEDFNSARENLQRARTKYNEALAYEESHALRQRSDSNLEQLGNEIVRLENEVVVRDVRRLKNQAREAYYNGDFETADNLLSQAKARWAVTNVDPDEEITNLTTLVSTALSMKTGRVIPTTAPLYPEMSQILSIAHQNFDKGKVLLSEGKGTEATDILNQAKEKLRSLQLVYPMNQEASLLSLRIDQLIDPDSFEKMFERKIKTARQDYKDPNKKQSAYTDLLDLYAINPKYPGLKQLIYEVEIAIGVRQKPVDRTAYTKSSRLATEAASIVAAAGRDESKLRLALAKADEALKLNPDNDEAMVLKDRIQTTIGGRAAVVLSSSDEAKYQAAIQELQKNNIIGANALVEQLLQTEVNRRSAKILDLQRKIKALL